MPRSDILLALPVGHGLTSIRTASSTFFQSKFALHVGYGIMKKEGVRISTTKHVAVCHFYMPSATSTCTMHEHQDSLGHDGTSPLPVHARQGS